MCFGSSCWNVLAASLGGKYLRRVNAIAPASTWMVRYAISSTPFWWHVRCDCPALLSIVLHWHPLWFGKLPNLQAPFVLLHRPLLSRLVGLTARRFTWIDDPQNIVDYVDRWSTDYFVYLDRQSTDYFWLVRRLNGFNGLTVFVDRRSTDYCWLRG